MWKQKRKKKFRSKKIYVHYGSDFLNKSMPMKDWVTGDKPKGIWASPKDTNWGWKNFCEYVKSFPYFKELIKSGILD